MSLISFDPSVNEQIDRRNEAIANAGAKSNRFNYPTKDEFYQFDQLNILLPFKWAGIDAPLLSLETTYSRDVVQHKFVKVGGAELEDTGRNPLQISASIVFVNTITPGSNEGWIQGTLYPDVYNQFIQSLINTKNGGDTKDLNHPQLGTVPCKVINISTQISGGYRGGAIITAQFLEDGLDTELDNGISDVISKISSNTIILQQSLAKLLPNPTALELVAVAGGLTGLLNTIKAIIDQGALIGMDALASITQISYRCNKIIESVNLANNMLYAKVVNFAYLVRGDSLLLAETFKKSLPVTLNQATAIYINKTTTTLSGLAQLLGNSTKNLMNLNPALLATPLIPPEVKVIYYTGDISVKPQIAGRSINV